MARFIINTTGTLNPVIFYDLGYRTFYTASTVNFDLTDEYTLNEISQSQDIQDSINNGYITAKDEYDNFIYSSVTVNITTLSGGTNLNLSGSSYNPVVNLNNNIFLNSISAQTLSANTLYVGGTIISPTNSTFVSLSAGTLSGGTIYSGGTNLYSIFATIPDQNDITRVQPGSNITTGGTANLPTINLVASPSINGLTLSGTGNANIFSATTISATTASILSSGLIIRNPANTFSNIFASSAIVANRTITIPLLTASDTLVTAAFIQTLTNKTLTSPVINTQITGTVTSGGTITTTNYILAANSVQTMTGKTINATTNTITDTSTSLGDLFKSNGTKFVRFAIGSALQHLRVNAGATDLEWANEDVTRVQPGTNITTGGTATSPIINLVASPSVNNLTISGLTSSSDGATFSILSGGTIFSGGTNLYSIFATIPDQNDVTRVQPGSNITTGGTENAPTINLAASPSINGLTFSGTAIGNALSVTTLSGGTIYSGGTDLYSIFATNASIVSTYVQPGTNITTGGSANLPIVNLVDSPSVNNITFSGTAIGGTVQAGSGTFTSLSAGTLSGGTIYSGGTDLYNIFLTTNDGNDITRVQPGTNITTGGSVNFPIVSVVASPSFNSITSSGASSFTTLSATTFISGSTNLYNIFAQPSLVVNNVNAGSNITTGGTAISPIISVAASPSLNGLTLSGTGQFAAVTATSLSAGTLSGGTILSGSTNLYSIFQAQTGVLKQKNGSVTGSTFSGNPKKATITFTTAFPDNNYAITITGEIDRTWTIESKTSAGFTINANANLQFNSSNVFWMAGQIGESN